MGICRVEKQCIKCAAWRTVGETEDDAYETCVLGHTNIKDKDAMFCDCGKGIYVVNIDKSRYECEVCGKGNEVEIC